MAEVRSQSSADVDRAGEDAASDDVAVGIDADRGDSVREGGHGERSDVGGVPQPGAGAKQSHAGGSPRWYGAKTCGIQRSSPAVAADSLGHVFLLGPFAGTIDIDGPLVSAGEDDVYLAKIAP
jgi:hypothetical protein